MKKQFLDFLQKELESKKMLLSSNSLSEEDKQLAQTAVDNLVATIDAVDQLEDENSAEAIEALKQEIESLNEGIRAVQEKLTQKKQEIIS